eukprot:754869-Hanusia_phi.AAC.2
MSIAGTQSTCTHAIMYSLEHQHHDMTEVNERQISLFPRRKQGEVEIPKKGRLPLTIDMSVIESLYTIPQVEACKILGISLTAMKQLCRKLGLDRWPYRRPCTKGRTRIRRKKISNDIGNTDPFEIRNTYSENANRLNESEDDYTEIEGQSDMDSMASTLASITSTSEKIGVDKHQDFDTLTEEDSGTDFSFLMDGSFCMDTFVSKLRTASAWDQSD